MCWGPINWGGLGFWYPSLSYVNFTIREFTWGIDAFGMSIFCFLSDYEAWNELKWLRIEFKFAYSTYFIFQRCKMLDSEDNFLLQSSLNSSFWTSNKDFFLRFYVNYWFIAVRATTCYINFSCSLANCLLITIFYSSCSLCRFCFYYIFKWPSIVILGPFENSISFTFKVNLSFSCF